jgi:uncharacterized protein
MPEDLIRYDLLAQAALRGVVRTVLTDVADKGLPGNHHFKITFATAAPGVRLSDRMRAQYPDTMTIILQHQFWDLAVREDAFEVGLSFGGIPEHLTVPFAALTAFFDPSVQFGFQFEMAEAEAAHRADAASTPEKPADAGVASPRPLAKPQAKERIKEVTKDSSRQKPKPEQPPNEPAPAAPSGSKSGEVVSLDRFRKK